MIEKMQQITVVCLAKDKQDAISALTDLGTVHVDAVQTPESEELTTLNQQYDALQQLQNRLSEFKKTKEEPLPPSGQPETRRHLFRQAIESLTAEKNLGEKILQLNQAIAQLEPWGQFSQNSLEELENAGYHAWLCAAPPQQLPELPEDCRMFIVHRDKTQVCFLVVSSSDAIKDSLPLASFPYGTDLAALRNEREECSHQLQAATAHLREFAARRQAELSDFAAQLQDELSFAQARDGMGASESLAYLNGYVPDESIDLLRTAARQHGWGIRYRDADPEDENVPTKLRIPRQFQIAQVVFDVIGVLPGYNEVDVSVPFTIFLTTFCGFLIGDAGYGLIFAAVAALLWSKYRNDAKKRLPVILMAVFSLAVIIFGALTGNWFGLDPASLPAFMRGIPWLSDDANGDHLKMLCFFIGATHLSIARVWSSFRSGKICRGLGHLGWGLFLWANYFLVNLLIIGTPMGFLPKALYTVGGVLILLFSINWRDFGDVIYSPFNFINSVVDVLSYIRLYAVGLSSLYIAQNFNNMATMIWDVSPWLIPIGLLVILGGHCLNIALAVMSVLVHGIRLNTLEFANHMGLNWSGKPYQPLSRTSNQP